MSPAERLKRIGRANEEARNAHLESLTLEKAIQMTEGFMSCHACDPVPRHDDHPESLAHRLRRRHA